MALPTKEARKTSGLEFVIVMAFGNPAESICRTDVSQFKRKKLFEIADLSGLMEDIDSFDDKTELLDSIRLAPSATNSQPWFIVPGKGKLEFFCEKPGIIRSIAYRKMNKIDMGIALCHCALAAAHAGKTHEFIFDTAAEARCPRNHYYTGTMMIMEPDVNASQKTK